jgi:hypothetical protein
MSCVAIASSLSGANPRHVWCVQVEVQTPQTTDESTNGSASSTSLLGRDEATSDGSGDERTGAGGPAGDSGGAAGGGGGGGMSGHDGHPGYHGGWHHGGSSTCPLPEDVMSREEFIARHAPPYTPDLKQTAQDLFFWRQDWYAYLAQSKAKREFAAVLEATASQLLGLLVSRGDATLSGDAATSAPPNSALNRSSLCSPSRPGALAEHACRRGAHASRCFVSRVPFPSLQRARGAARTGDGVRRFRPLV